MRGELKLTGIVALLTASSLNAQGLVPTVIGNFIAMQNSRGAPKRWVYDTDADYAVWDASSSAPAGGEVSSDGKSIIAIDQAPLAPQSNYQTEQDLIADGKIWLPKGGLVVKMVGGENGGNWFCTWRFDEIALATSAQFPEHERELCLQTDGSGHTIANRLEFSFWPALLTILPSVREVTIKGLNSASLHETDRNALPPRMKLKIVAGWHSRKGGTVCLYGKMDRVEAIKEQCFGGVGESMEYGGGRYTLIAMSQNSSFKIRIDRALNVHGLAPQRR